MKISKNQFLKSFAILLIALSFSCEKPIINEIEQPNILLIITDDQGYGDLSLTENPYAETPVIDQLAKEGTLVNQFYVSPVWLMRFQATRNLKMPNWIFGST